MFTGRSTSDQANMVYMCPTVARAMQMLHEPSSYGASGNMQAKSDTCTCVLLWYVA